MRNRDPFGVALGMIRESVRTGTIRPGAPLIVEDLARDLRLSSTPIREALAHLAGRGLVQGRRLGGRGYAAWPVSAVDLADLYEFQGMLAVFAVRRIDLESELSLPQSAAASGSPAQWADQLFFSWARATSNAPLLEAQAFVSDRLYLARSAEGEVLPDAAAEFADLRAGDRSRASLVLALERYSGRRVAVADRIARAVLSLSYGNIERK